MHFLEVVLLKINKLLGPVPSVKNRLSLGLLASFGFFGGVKMKKRTFLSMTVLAMTLVLSLASAARGAEGRWDFRLKLTAGPGFLLGGGGDLETLRRDYQDWAGEWDSRGYFTSSTLDWAPIPAHADMRLELLATTGRNLGFSFGIGTAAFSSRGDLRRTYDITQSGYGMFVIDEDASFEHRFDIRLIPLELKAYYFVPLGKGMSLYACAGPGLFLGILDHKYEHHSTYNYDEFNPEPDQDYSRETSYQALVTEEARGTALGLQGGAGWEYRLAPFVSLGIECSFRAANIKNWKGDGELTYVSTERIYREDEGWGPTVTESGTVNEDGALWHFFYRDPYTWEQSPEMFIRTDEPQGEDYLNVRRAGVSLNAFRICIVLQFHL